MILLRSFQAESVNFFFFFLHALVLREREREEGRERRCFRGEEIVLIEEYTVCFDE